MEVDEHVPPEVKEQFALSSPLNSERTKEKRESTRGCRGCSGRTNKVNSLWLDRQQKERETKEERPGNGNRKSADITRYTGHHLHLQCIRRMFSSAVV